MRILNNTSRSCPRGAGVSRTHAVLRAASVAIPLLVFLSSAHAYTPFHHMEQRGLTAFPVSRIATPERPVSSLAGPLAAPDSGADDARTYLLRTSHPGYTMMAQGVQTALACLHPTFVTRLAAAIHTARQEGIPASIFSACRPPALRVGGFEDKFRSMHAYGLAVDMTGIGAPGSSTSRRWHAIAATYKIYGVYGAGARHEWNHYQATGLLSAPAALRPTITAHGPPSLDKLFTVATRFIDRGLDLVMHPHHHHRRT